MSDINDRLAALDPAAHDPYHAHNLDQMISRIVASSPSGAARSAWWQRVQLRIAGTLILGTLVGAGTLAVVGGGPSLATLAIQTTVTHHPGTFATAAVSDMRCDCMVVSRQGQVGRNFCAERARAVRKAHDR